LTDSSGDKNQARKIQFSVASISCIACTPAFKKGLEHLGGIKEVKQLPMLNRIVAEFDPAREGETEVKEEIFGVADRAGFKGKVIMSKY
jgi:copper chaperone CopZ